MHMGKRTPYERLPRAERLRIKAANREKKIRKVLSETTTVVSGDLNSLDPTWDIVPQQETVPDQEAVPAEEPDSCQILVPQSELVPDEDLVLNEELVADQTFPIVQKSQEQQDLFQIQGQVPPEDHDPKRADFTTLEFLSRQESLDFVPIPELGPAFETLQQQ